MTNRINPNPNYYSLAAKKRQKEVEERMALLNKINILNFISEEDDLVCFFICFLGKCIIICSIVYIFYSSIIDIYESYLDFNFSKQNITEY